MPFALAGIIVEVIANKKANGDPKAMENIAKTAVIIGVIDIIYCVFAFMGLIYFGILSSYY